MQKVNFRFEIIICDDASEDRTQEIIKERYAMLPEDIKKVISDANLPTKIENIANKITLAFSEYKNFFISYIYCILGSNQSIY